MAFVIGVVCGVFGFIFAAKYLDVKFKSPCETGAPNEDNDE